MLNMHERVHKSSTEVTPTPERRSVQGGNRKLYLEKDYHNELSKIMAKLSPDSAKHPSSKAQGLELHRLHNIELVS